MKLLEKVSVESVAVWHVISLYRPKAVTYLGLLRSLPWIFLNSVDLSSHIWLLKHDLGHVKKRLKKFSIIFQSRQYCHLCFAHWAQMWSLEALVLLWFSSGPPHHRFRCILLQEDDNLLLLFSESTFSEVPAEPKFKVEIGGGIPLMWNAFKI